MFNLKYYFNGGFDVEDLGWFEDMEEIEKKLKEDWNNGWFVDWDEEGYEVYDENGNQIDC